MLSLSTRVRVGFIGVGSVAVDHAAVVLDLGHLVVAGTGTSESSPRWRKFQAIVPEARFVSNIDSLLEASDIDKAQAQIIRSLKHQLNVSERFSSD